MGNTYNRILLITIFCLICICAKAIHTETLLEAVKDNDLRQVKELLQKGANVNSRDEKGQTALMWAVLKNDRPLVEYLIEQGADVNHQSNHLILSSKKMTVVDCAVMTGDTLTLDFLRKNGARLIREDEPEINSFYYVIDRGDKNMISYFLNHTVLSEKQEKVLLAFILAKETNLPVKDLVVFMMERGYKFNIEDEEFYQNLCRLTKNKPEKSLAYLQPIREWWKEVQEEKHLVDSILSLSPEQLENDPYFRYRITNTFSAKGHGLARLIPRVVKDPRVILSGNTHPNGYKTYYRNNNLANPYVVGGLICLYSGLLLWILFVHHKAAKAGIHFLLWFLIILYFFLLYVIIHVSIESLVFNSNELVTRMTGTKARALVSWELESYTTRSYGRAPSREYTTHREHVAFHCFPSDTVKYEIYGGKTTLSYSYEAQELDVRINKKGDKIAAEITWHTYKNILFIIVNIVTLVLIFLLFIGKLNNLLVHLLVYLLPGCRED